jgi:hypothetical protein
MVVIMTCRDRDDSVLLGEPNIFMNSSTQSQLTVDYFKPKRALENLSAKSRQGPEETKVASSSSSPNVCTFGTTNVSGKRVSFSNVRVREHCIIIGDSPLCKVLPLSLGWSFADEKTYDVNAYEQKKEQRRSHPCNQRPQRENLASKLSLPQRVNLLTKVSGMEYADLMWLDRQRRYDDEFA